MRWLTAIPIYNEAPSVCRVLAAVRPFSPEILAVNDGSTDGTAELLAQERDLHLVTHPTNRGYGAALISAFRYTLDHGFDALVTIDCDGQHDPEFIPSLLPGLRDADIVSGSRYLKDFEMDTPAPTDRRFINRQITRELNERYGLKLTDAFCGFKAYRREALAKLQVTETGWGMPLQVWVQAARLNLRIKEVAVPRIYLDPNRSFGGILNDAGQRVAYYRRVIEQADAQPIAGASVRCPSCGRLVPPPRPVPHPACFSCGNPWQGSLGLETVP